MLRQRIREKTSIEHTMSVIIRYSVTNVINTVIKRKTVEARIQKQANSKVHATIAVDMDTNMPTVKVIRIGIGNKQVIKTHIEADTPTYQTPSKENTHLWRM